MSKDYKNRIPAYRQEKRPWPARNPGLALAVAAGAAVLAALTYYFASRPDTDTPAASASPTAPVAANASRPRPDQPPANEAIPAAPAVTNSRPEPRFSFYKLLPEKEVIVAENEIRSAMREESQGKHPAGLYMVQAGSFTRQGDAEALKARLAELKLKARLEMITLDHATWYRVKVGPYGSMADADRVRQHLRAGGIDSVVQKAAR